MLLEAGH